MPPLAGARALAKPGIDGRAELRLHAQALTSLAAWIGLSVLGAHYWPLWAGGTVALACWLSLVIVFRAVKPGLWQLRTGLALGALAGLILHAHSAWAKAAVLLLAVALALLVVYLSLGLAKDQLHAQGRLQIEPAQAAAPNLGFCGLHWQGERWSSLLRACPLTWAQLAMLPMMAGLPMMSQWCGAQGLSPAEGYVIHALVMLVPWWVLRWLGTRAQALLRPRNIALVLMAALAPLCLGSAVQGLMGAMFLHALAWSMVAARVSISSRRLSSSARAEPDSGARPVPKISKRAFALPVAVLLTGAALQSWGIQGLLLMHLWIACMGGLWCALRWLPQAIGWRRS